MTIGNQSPGDILDLINYRVQCSIATLKEADCLSANNLWPGALNRLYYSCYYLVVALLLKKGIAVKTHAGVKSMFNLHFVKSGLITPESGRFFRSIFDLRHMSDYDDYIACDEDTYKTTRREAELFFDELKSVLKEIN